MCGIVACRGREHASDFLITALRRLEYRGYDSAGIAVTGSEPGRTQSPPAQSDASRRWSPGSPPSGHRPGSESASGTPDGRPTAASRSRMPTRTWTAPARSRWSTTESSTTPQSSRPSSGGVATLRIPGRYRGRRAPRRGVVRGNRVSRGGHPGDRSPAPRHLGARGDGGVGRGGRPGLAPLAAGGRHRPRRPRRGQRRHRAGGDGQTLCASCATTTSSCWVTRSPGSTTWAGRFLRPRACGSSGRPRTSSAAPTRTSWRRRSPSNRPSWPGSSNASCRRSPTARSGHSSTCLGRHGCASSRCGTSLHASQVTARTFGALAGLPAETVVASEYDQLAAPGPAEGLLTIAVSQSGETSDVLDALESVDSPVLAITNRPHSSLARRSRRRARVQRGPGDRGGGDQDVHDPGRRRSRAGAGVRGGDRIPGAHDGRPARAPAGCSSRSAGVGIHDGVSGRGGAGRGVGGGPVVLLRLPGGRPARTRRRAR